MILEIFYDLSTAAIFQIFANLQPFIYDKKPYLKDWVFKNPIKARFSIIFKTNTIFMKFCNKLDIF